MSVFEAAYAAEVPTRLPETKSGSVPSLDIIDIRGDAEDFDLKSDILSMLDPVTGARKLPTLLLYDEKGLQLFEDVNKK